MDGIVGHVKKKHSRQGEHKRCYLLVYLLSRYHLHSVTSCPLQTYICPFLVPAAVASPDTKSDCQHDQKLYILGAENVLLRFNCKDIILGERSTEETRGRVFHCCSLHKSSFQSLCHSKHEHCLVTSIDHMSFSYITGWAGGVGGWVYSLEYKEKRSWTSHSTCIRQFKPQLNDSE